MTPAEIRAARQRLGLSANGFARALKLGKDGGRTVRRWEAGDSPVSGPVGVAVELLLRENGSATLSHHSGAPQAKSLRD